jgi:cysteine desulfuration protein SufE
MYIIQLVKNLPLIKDEFKTESNVIKAANRKCGCRERKRKKIVLTADSDAILTKELSRF